MWNEDLERLGVQMHFPAGQLSREPLLLDLQAPKLDSTGQTAISNFLFRSELVEFEFPYQLDRELKVRWTVRSICGSEVSRHRHLAIVEKPGCTLHSLIAVKDSLKHGVPVSSNVSGHIC